MKHLFATFILLGFVGLYISAGACDGGADLYLTAATGTVSTLLFSIGVYGYRRRSPSD